MQIRRSAFKSFIEGMGIMVVDIEVVEVRERGL